MIGDEFEDLLQSISRGLEDSSRPSADDVIVKTYRFFAKLKEELKVANSEEKEEIMNMIKVMQDKVNEYSKKNCEKVGMTESELMRLSDDTDVFTPEQKKVLEMAKRDMMESSKTIRTHLSHRNVENKSVTIEEEGKKGAKSQKKKAKRRGDWMKS